MTGMHYEMRFSGTGGQGVMLMGDILAQAAGIQENQEVLLLKSYGPEARGGACRSELIIDQDNINYPVLDHPDFVLAMSQQACDQYTGDMDGEKGVLVVDSELVKKVPDRIHHVYRIPLVRLAVEETGKPIAANVVALGAIAVLASGVHENSVRKAMLGRFSRKFQEQNEKAFAAGVTAAKQLQ